jgi:drug/metabolite transporter (DMT)-like permease
MLQTTLLILLDITLVVAGQFCMKFGINKVGSFTSMAMAKFLLKAFTSPLILLGVAFYAISAVIWIIILSKVDLSFAYPMLSIGYVLVLIISWAFLGESINVIKVLGIIFICLGIVFIFRS